MELEGSLITMDIVPTFATHYCRADRYPFLNLSDVPDTELDEVIKIFQTLESVNQNVCLGGVT